MEHTEVIAITHADTVLTKMSVSTQTVHAQKDVIRAMWEFYAKHVSNLQSTHICFGYPYHHSN